MPEWLYAWLYLRPELLLLVVAILLYLQDLALLLFANEVVFFRAAGGRWIARTARRYPEFGRRHLALLRPWQPGTMVVRSSWPRATSGGRDPCRQVAARIAAVERTLRPLRYQALALLVTIFVVLPCLYGFVGPSTFLVGVAVAYAQAALMISCVLVARDKLGLPGKTLAWLALESLVCIPYAVNLHRKLAARLAPADAEPLALAEALLDSRSCADFRQELLEALDVYIGRPGADESRQNRLKQYRQRVIERSAV